MGEARKKASLQGFTEPLPPFAVVGVGASAGGLEAPQDLLSHLPHDCPASFIVVTHLDPERKGMLPELLSRCTAMPVVEAQHG